MLYYSFHLFTLLCRPTAPYSWKGFIFGSKQFGVNGVVHYVEINTSRKNKTPPFEVAPLNTLSSGAMSDDHCQMWRVAVVALLVAENRERQHL